jgi:pilus assembly protein CpaF
MELSERITSGAATPEPFRRDPFADVKDRIHKAVIGGLGPSLFNAETDPATLRSRVQADIAGQLDRETGIARTDRERIAREIADDILGHGPIERLLADETITEIMVNGASEVWIERQGRLYHTPVTFIDDSHLRRIIVKMVTQAGRRVDESHPMVDARLPDGSRLNAVLPPLSLNGPLLTIRKFPTRRLAADDLIRLGTLTAESTDFLERCVKARLNVLISGGTGTGKTTLLNIMSGAIPEEDRLVTIEETAELQLHQQHVLRLESRIKNAEGDGQVTIRDLVRNSLRMRPDRIIVGEVRGAEALDMLQAMNTGHDGSLCTLHANTTRDALSRLETMVLMAGYDLPVRAIRQQVSSALDMVVQLERVRDGSRRVTGISEILRMEGDVITLQDIFKFHQDDVTVDGAVVGGLASTGLRPSFLDKFERQGVSLPAGIFTSYGHPPNGHREPRLPGGVRR